jgi:NADPH-dependent 2,4-dienoyl-CoA reductase/sulfur reductase-like enzyme
MSVMPIADKPDVAVIGAGPAGLTAAATCANAGLVTVLFDEQPAAGGQIYRSVTETPVRDTHVLGASYWRGSALVEAFVASGARYIPGATVWSLTREREIGVSFGGGSQLVTAKRVIVCTGALERPMPIPGWTLPGVMTAGAAQILLKSSGLVASARTVLAGCGPLLWLFAAQYLEAGAKLEAILDTTPGENRMRAAPHAVPFFFSSYFREGLALLRRVKREVSVIDGVTSLGAIGQGHVTSVAYARGNSAQQTIPVDNLFLHQGVAPNVNLAMSAGIEHRWDDLQLAWVPVLGSNGESSLEGIAIAGDGAGIAGAQAARWRGVIAGIAASRALGASISDGEERTARRELAQSLRGRRFLDALYRPAKVFRQPTGDTIVCRCEEVTAREIAQSVALGCPGPNQMKAFLRCGMGPCQGRLCGLTVTELIAEQRGVEPQAVGYYRLRPPVKPVTLGELAALPKSEAAVKAVVRM